jgi:predicted MFS family arabinose efflux permease
MTLSPFRTIALLITLYVTGMMAAAQFAKISVVFVSLAALYPQAGSALGFLVSLLSFVGIVFGLFAGLLVATLGPRRLLLSAVALAATLSFAQATLPDFLPMLASRVFEGVSHLIIVVAAPTLMGQISPPPLRGLVMTLWSTFFGVAFAITAFIGLPLVQDYGIGALFVGHGAVMVAVGLLLAVLLPKDAPDAGQAKLTLPFIAREHAAAYASPFVAAPAVGWLFYTLTFVSLITVIPAYVPEGERAFAVSGMALSGMLGALFTGFVVLRFATAVQAVMAGFFSSALVIAAFSATGETWLAILLFACLGLVQGGSFAAIPELNEAGEAQARANGALAQMGNLGNTIGTPLLLLVTAMTGIWGLTFFAVTAYIGGLALHFWLSTRRRNA